MDAFRICFVRITSRWKNIVLANERGKQLRDEGAGSRRRDQLKSNCLLAALEQPRAALAVARGLVLRVHGTRAGIGLAASPTGRRCARFCCDSAFGESAAKAIKDREDRVGHRLASKLRSYHTHSSPY